MQKINIATIKIFAVKLHILFIPIYTPFAGPNQFDWYQIHNINFHFFNLNNYKTSYYN